MIIRNIQDSVLPQFLIFSAVGAVGTAGQYLVLVFLVRVVSIYPVWASSVGFIVGALINYILNYKITFKSNKKHLETSIKFFIIAIIGLCLNTGLMMFIIEALNIYYLLAQVIVTLIVLLWNFSGNKLWTFKE